MRRRSPTRVARLYAALVELRRQPAGRRRGGRAARALTPAKLGARLYPGRSATISPIWRRRRRRWRARSATRSAIAEPLRRRLKEGFGIEARIVPARAARRRQPALRPAPQAADALGAAAAREPHLRPRLPARPDRVPAAARRDGRGRRAARRADPAPAPHEPRQLCRRRDHDALCAASSRRRRSTATTSTGCAPRSAPASSRSRTG